MRKVFEISENLKYYPFIARLLLHPHFPAFPFCFGC